MLVARLIYLILIMSRKKERNQPYIYEQVEQYLRPKRKIKPLLNQPTNFEKVEIISWLNNMSSSEIKSLYKKLYKALRKERKRIERESKKYGQWEIR